MSTTLQNSIWPNAGGTLGEIKTQIPDGVTIKWPDGDALVGNFVYRDGKLVGFVDTKALIENDSKTTVLPYDFVDITVDKRLETLMTFNAGERCKRLNMKYDIFLPKGYKRLEYLESTGTQWINTGIKLQISDDIKCRYSAKEVSSSSLIFGTYTAPLIAYFSQVGGIFKNSQFWWGELGGNTTLQFTNVSPEQIVDVIVSNKTVQVNNVIKSIVAEDFEAIESCKLFANRAQFPSSARLYSFSISRAGEMQLNLIPCLNDTGTPCMYDIISQEPLYNEGTGQFLYPGAESQVVTSDLDEIFYAKKTAHGIQKLYHVPEDFSGSKDEYAIENGFKQLVEPPMPIEGHWIPEWAETDTQLICNWIEADVPEI